MRGYNVIDPSGVKHRLWYQDEASKTAAVDRLLAAWDAYINSNWISPSYKEPFTPEDKVKLFLDGLAYYLLDGKAEDIVTDYKELMNGKREIPISSCPPAVADALYGTGCNPRTGADDNYFGEMTAQLDERAAKVERKAKPKPRVKRPSPSEKIRAAVGGQKYDGVTFATVDTDGIFVHGGSRYRIDNSVEQYKPVRTAVGLLYDMDKIIIVTAGGEPAFFDMRYDMIPREKIIRVA